MDSQQSSKSTMLLHLNPHYLNCLILTLTSSAMLSAVYLESMYQLLPCSLCYVQRFWMICIILFTGINILLGSSPKKLLGLYLATIVSAIGGSAFAIRQLWLQQLPKDQIPSCSPSIEYMLNNFPFLETMQVVLSGGGNCATEQLGFAGISIPGWALLIFVLVITLSLNALLTHFPPKN